MSEWMDGWMDGWTDGRTDSEQWGSCTGMQIWPIKVSTGTYFDDNFILFPYLTTRCQIKLPLIHRRRRHADRKHHESVTAAKEKY